MKISDILKERQTLSFEFFPPKKDEGEAVLFDTITALKDRNPDFVSITYGAGGSTRDKTMRWTRSLAVDFGLTTMMHLTCVNAERENTGGILDELSSIGVDNVLALRGDEPNDVEAPPVDQREFSYASDLVKFIRGRGDDVCIGIAGYPEGHLECAALTTDTEHLRKKVDAGGDFIITQLFFDNRYYFDFMDRIRRAGITVPVIAGIMPITNIGQVLRFTQMCGATVPDAIARKMDGKSPEDMMKIGVEYAVKQCEELKNAGAAGLHFYTLNRSAATGLVLDGLGKA